MTLTQPAGIQYHWRRTIRSRPEDDPIITTLRLLPGDPAPTFHGESDHNPRFAFHTVAGRYVVLSFFRSAGDGESSAFLETLMRGRAQFDDKHAAFFGVSSDPSDRTEGRIRPQVPGVRFFHDHDLAIARLYELAEEGDSSPLRASFVLDPNLRIVWSGLMEDPEVHAAAILAVLRAVPPIGPIVPALSPAPVLLIPRVFEPGFCAVLIDLYDKTGSIESGFMREAGGKTVLITDPSHKRRADCVVEDEQMRTAARARIVRRVIPEIRKAFMASITRMERYIVACYAAADGGHFRAHRDNTTKGTAHRRFAVTINLNAGAYDGGDLRFPEYGPQTYRAPTGGAVVFSCGLLHEAMPVTAGRRYAFLPFLYDDEGARIREANRQYLADDSDGGARTPATEARIAEP